MARSKLLHGICTKFCAGQARPEPAFSVARALWTHGDAQLRLQQLSKPVIPRTRLPKFQTCDTYGVRGCRGRNYLDIMGSRTDTYGLQSPTTPAASCIPSARDMPQQALHSDGIVHPLAARAGH